MELSKDIQNIILIEREKYVEENKLSSYEEINSGNCEYFRDIVISKLEKLFPNETFTPVSVRDFQGFDTVWDENYMESKGIEPPDIFNNMLDIPYHAWLVHENIHYDAELAEGTINFFELPFFKWYSSLSAAEKDAVIEESKQQYNEWNKLMS